MKKSFSLLLAFSFLQVQSWALSGGPVFPGSPAAVKGTYAGSMVPSLGSNSLGIFALGVPSTGLASGVFAMFVSGGAFYGSIIGVIDSDKLTLNALAQAQQNSVRTDFFNGQLEIITIPVALASGLIQAALTPPSQGAFGSGGSTGGYRLSGTGQLQTSNFPPGGGAPVPGISIDVVVDGFQQSTTVDSTININTLTGTQSSGSGS